MVNNVLQPGNTICGCREPEIRVLSKLKAIKSDASIFLVVVLHIYG
jgi:hypothetical protein